MNLKIYFNYTSFIFCCIFVSHYLSIQPLTQNLPTRMAFNRNAHQENYFGHLFDVFLIKFQTSVMTKNNPFTRKDQKLKKVKGCVDTRESSKIKEYHVKNRLTIG